MLNDKSVQGAKTTGKIQQGCSTFLGQSYSYEDSDGTTAEVVLYFTAHRNFKIASTTLLNNNNRDNKLKKSHMHSKSTPIYLDYNRMKTIQSFLFEYKNAF